MPKDKTGNTYPGTKRTRLTYSAPTASGANAPKLNHGNGERVRRARIMRGPSLPKENVRRSVYSTSPPATFGAWMERMREAGESGQAQASARKVRKGMCWVSVGRKGWADSRRFLYTFMRLQEHEVMSTCGWAESSSSNLPFRNVNCDQREQCPIFALGQ